MKGSTILVTGAAGFIGSHLVDALLDRGHRVVGLDNFDPFYERQLKENNLRAAVSSPAFRLVEGDIRDAESLDALFAGSRIDAVVHLAARAGVRPSLEQPALYADVNVRGTLVLLESMRRAGVGRMIYASSSSVYGGNEKVPFAEDDPADRPISPYAATKRATELVCETFHRLYGMDAIGLRFFTAYGPRQRPEMAIHRFVRRVESGEPVPMFGDGSMRRDYTYVGDIVQGVIGAIDRARGCRIFNLGESETTRLDTLIHMIGAACGREPIIEPRPEEPGDVPQTYADISRAKSELGYAPNVTLRDGLEHFVAWYRAERAVRH